MRKGYRIRALLEVYWPPASLPDSASALPRIVHPNPASRIGSKSRIPHPFSPLHLRFVTLPRALFLVA
jgi:hypothetical protein